MIKNRRLSSAFMLLTACTLFTAGFTSRAASLQPEVKTAAFTEDNGQNPLKRTVIKAVPAAILNTTKIAIEQEQTRLIQEAAAEAARIEQEAKEQAAREQAEREAKAASVSGDSQRLLAAIIFCEAGNQPYEGQVAVGAVVMNRVNSGVFPGTIEEVIYQPGQFGPAGTGWLDKVRASGSYTDSAMQAAADALAGANPVGGCLYFDKGNHGMKIGDHYFH